MTKRNEISDEVRDDAAALCAAMADWWGGWPAGLMSAPRNAWQDTDVYSVSREALDAVERFARGMHSSDVWREAEALLRDGWCPGDPVRRRKVSP